MLADLEEAEGEGAAAGDEDEEEEYIYNPLKLPLGWDGKPIPYWLYKLHGLNMEFKCEICGNYRCDGSSVWAGGLQQQQSAPSDHVRAATGVAVP